MLKTNQNGGFDCPGCAWGDSPEAGAVKFCENGAKAVNWEATRRRVDAAFFARHSVSQLREQSDYWLEYQGRLTEPVRYEAASDRYRPITWDDAFALIARHLNGQPARAAFYTSGRASNEAAYLYQLFGRSFGTNNFPDCSNMCHEASGVALTESIGVGKGTVTLEDFDHADAIFVLGQNPGTNHPRMLEPLRRALERGAQVVCFNPLRERGTERFQHPQKPIEMLANGTRQPTASTCAPTLAAIWPYCAASPSTCCNGNAKRWGAADRRCSIATSSPSTPMPSMPIWRRSMPRRGRRSSSSPGSNATRSAAAAIYRDAGRTIVCWAMGITQHHHSVATIQEIANLLMLRGNLGKPGAGACPVRGHSNVQGDRTMGINERPPAALLDALERHFALPMSRQPGTTPWNASRPCWPARCRYSSAWAATSPRPRRTARAPAGRCATAR